MSTILIILPTVLLFVVLGVWVERKVAGFIHDRVGPDETGYKGLLQTVADGLKLLQKEQIVPFTADKAMFVAAPVIIFIAVFAAFATIPLAPELVGANMKIGVFYLLAIVSLDVLGYMMAGWASANKFSLYGAMRAVAQIISYEVPVSLLVLSVVMVSNSLDLQEIVMQQGILSEDIQYLFGLKVLGVQINHIGGFLMWNVFRYPPLMLGVIAFFIASLAEANRAPFDIPEAESEIIAGFQTEYSGFRWSVIMLSEYAMMLLVAFLGVILFLGGWNTPLPNMGGLKLAEWTTGTSGEFSGYAWGISWLYMKAFVWIFLQMWVRWTYPRLRVDQLMYLCWKVLTPFALLLVLLAGVWRLLMI